MNPYHHITDWERVGRPRRGPVQAGRLAGGGRYAFASYTLPLPARHLPRVGGPQPCRSALRVVVAVLHLQ